MKPTQTYRRSVGVGGLILGVLVLTLSAAASAQPGAGWYKLKTQFQGEGKCLEGNQFDPGAVLGGAAFMDNCQNVSGQLFKFVPEGTSGYYRVKTQFQGEGKCLEGNKYDQGAVLKGAAFMDNCQNVTGQFWKLIADGTSGYYRLKTQFQGDGKCLEGNQFPNPGGQDPAASPVQKGGAFMDSCQNVSGQLWKLVPA